MPLRSWSGVEPRVCNMPFSWYQKPVSVRYVAADTSDCLDSRKLGRKLSTVSLLSFTRAALEVAASGSGVAEACFDA